jgi:hypothetical protein
MGILQEGSYTRTAVAARLRIPPTFTDRIRKERQVCP